MSDKLVLNETALAVGSTGTVVLWRQRVSHVVFNLTVTNFGGVPVERPGHSSVSAAHDRKETILDRNAVIFSDKLASRIRSTVRALK
jgi:hypothetical protein